MSNYKFSRDKYKEEEKIIKNYFNSQKDISQILDEIRASEFFNSIDFEFIEHLFNSDITAELPRVLFIHHGGGIRCINQRKPESLIKIIENQSLNIEIIKNELAQIKSQLENLKIWGQSLNNLNHDKNLFLLDQFINNLKMKLEPSNKGLSELNKETFTAARTPLKTKYMYILSLNKKIELVKFPNTNLHYASQELYKFFDSTKSLFPRNFPWLSIPSSINYNLGEAIVYRGNSTKYEQILFLREDGKWKHQNEILSFRNKIKR
jgi:hypothetical protein